MKRLLMVVLAFATFGIAGCVENKYPVSGEPCGPADPVKELDARDCTAAPEM